MGRVGRLFVSTVVFGALSLPVAYAQGTDGAGSSPFPDTVQLPQTATIGSFANTNFQFHVAPATSKDLNRMSTRGISAWAITIKNGVDGWDGPTNLAPPRAVLNAPKELREKIALFQVESALGGGWVAVPSGWQVVSAVAGAQGSWGVTFIAPSGSHGGWITLGGSGPGATEVFSGAEGFFPGAYHLENEIIPGELTHDPTLSPTPRSLVHPNPCTALVSYKSGGLIVNGLKQLGDDGITGFFIALPDNEAELQKILFAAFRMEHPVSSCPKDINDW